jgi:osmotically-inducible protein OsmY
VRDVIALMRLNYDRFTSAGRARPELGARRSRRAGHHQRVCLLRTGRPRLHLSLTNARKEQTMYSPDQRVRADIRTALANDPRLPEPDEVAIEVYDGDVTLRGTVGSFAQQRAATGDARRTVGVRGVYDELRVRLLDEDRRKDAEIRGHALQRLIWDAELPGDYLEVEVDDGWVTLKGEVDHQYQSDAAFADVWNLHGVTGVTNKIKVIEARLP